MPVDEADFEVEIGVLALTSFAAVGIMATRLPLEVVAATPLVIDIDSVAAAVPTEGPGLFSRRAACRLVDRVVARARTEVRRFIEALIIK